jgi:hypothetical protein
MDKRLKENIDILKLKLQNEYENIIKTKWTFLNNNYINENINYHRKEDLYEIRHIQDIKKEIFDKIGPLATFAFITDFCSNFKLPGPYNEVDKALVVLYHMVCGLSINQMILYMDVSNYFRIYRYIFIKKYDELEKWINDLMNNNYFSNKNIRLLTSFIMNPENFKHVTMLLDGHHNRIIYENINIDKNELYSWKLQKPGLNTQFIIDLNKIVLYISESLPCRDNNDDKMFINNIEFKKFFTSYDNICFDGLYENTLLETIQKYEKNIDMSISNFTYPIKKLKNITIDEDDEKFNKSMASFRSIIETFFADLGNTFKRFHGKNNIRVTKLKTYNIQLKLICILMNIKKFSEISNLNLSDSKYIYWTLNNFDYPRNSDILPKSRPLEFRFNNINDIKDKQIDLLNIILSNTDINEENSNIIDEIENEKHYEVQYIISSRFNNKYNENEYFVKWKKYSKKHNSWVRESQFDDDTLINNFNNNSTMDED